MHKLTMILLLMLIVSGVSAKDYAVSSPSGKLAVKVTVNEQVSYTVLLNGKEIVAPSPISMEISDGTVWGAQAKVKKAKTTSVSQELRPAVKVKRTVIKDEYNLLTLTFSGYSLEFRAYDEGAAYRWVSATKGDYQVMSEQVTFAFPADHNIWFPEEESLMSHQERAYLKEKLSNIGSERFGSTGMLVDCGNGVKTYISESGLMDYPGMWLRGCDENKNALKGKFAGVVLEEKKENDRDVRPVKYADYIAQCSGPRVFPWRVMLITENDAALVESPLIYQLAPEQKIENTDWIKPGKVAWDWWNANNIYGVDFESGVNNETYKYFIDFASANGLEYIILDEGWYHLGDVLDVVDEIDIQELVDYGKAKNVEIILWVVWKTLDEKLVEALDQFQKWGVKGIKIDFMQRDDQWMVNFYEKIAMECAKRQLLVDYHGAYKPSGLDRAYPNVVSYEGVKGLENAKWSNLPDPEHDVTLPFIRMVAGPMDYTPGAMINKTKQNFHFVFTEPMSQGTRCHQLGMYVVYESPLQMLADNPSNYYREPGCMEFLSVVPSVWDDTKVLEAKVSDYIAVARRSGDSWYVGAMTDWDPRTLELKLDFLGEGTYTMKVWKDGVNATKHAADFAQETVEVTSGSAVKVNMAPGGGWVAIIEKK
ncbi:glycoside hydrolase family 97 protein [Maribellus sp. CM-23]|uniref:glycoside hydrolase family 97 protein n=1 Tax=Maribellus sp. CM-23 TaxID=2781026 RepID=UPI001F21F1A7|nr:glycoside hydrolase family 97 protein [Maribellus sp. CM-23]MCE4563803.1 glycoside hydrolase family 97 protein [Maribellus sp. CM-23]